MDQLDTSSESLLEPGESGLFIIPAQAGTLSFIHK